MFVCGAVFLSDLFCIYHMYIYRMYIYSDTAALYVHLLFVPFDTALDTAALYLHCVCINKVFV